MEKRGSKEREKSIKSSFLKYEERNRQDNLARKALERVREAALSRGDVKEVFKFKSFRNFRRTRRINEIEICTITSEIYESINKIEDENIWLIAPSPALVNRGIGARIRRQKLSKLSENFASLRVNMGWEKNLEALNVAYNLEEILGKEVANHCQIENYQDGILVFRASSTAWEKQINFLRGIMIEKISKKCGPEVVREVVIIGPNKPSWKHGKFSLQGGRGPRDTYG